MTDSGVVNAEFYYLHLFMKNTIKKVLNCYHDTYI